MVSVHEACSDMFDQNFPHTFDKVMIKHIPMNKLSKLDLDLTFQGHSKIRRQQLKEQKHATSKKARIPLGTN